MLMEEINGKSYISISFSGHVVRFLVVSMQLGFAMLEVGGVREAHRMTVLAKNLGEAFGKPLGLASWENTAAVPSTSSTFTSFIMFYHVLSGFL